jgi:hypothetical protein
LITAIGEASACMPSQDILRLPPFGSDGGESAIQLLEVKVRTQPAGSR